MDNFPIHQTKRQKLSPSSRRANIAAPHSDLQVRESNYYEKTTNLFMMNLKLFCFDVAKVAIKKSVRKKIQRTPHFLLRKPDYRFALSFDHSSTAGMIPSEMISSRIFCRCS